MSLAEGQVTPPAVRVPLPSGVVADGTATVLRSASTPTPRGGALATVRDAAVHVLEQVHESEPRVVVLAVDLALAAVTTVVAGLPVPAGALFAGTTLVVGVLSGLYAVRDRVQTRGVLWYPVRPIVPVTCAALVVLGAHLGDQSAVLHAVGVLLASLVVVRCLTWAMLVTLRRHGIGLLPTLLVGSGGAAALVHDRLCQFPEAGLAPVATRSLRDLLAAGGTAAAVRATGARHVVLVPSHDHGADLAASLCSDDHLPDIAFSMVPPLADLFLRPGGVGEVGGVPLVPLGWPLRSRRTFPGKRVFDVVVAGALLVAVLPVLTIAALAVKLQDGGPVLYRQRRVGRYGRPFAMLKLRSMTIDAECRLAELAEHNAADGLLFKMERDPRVTRVGAWLRRLSIDELPQLLNVLRGEMSLVGPRPLPVDPDRFGPVDSQRHVAPPGITGYWQVSGGTGLTYAEMIRLDLAYVRAWSLWLDIRLLLRTVPALVHRHGPA